MRRAVETVYGGELIDRTSVNSDFRQAAEKYRNEYLPSINYRTMVVILDDGHNKKQVIWMTPEPKWGWSLGYREMPLYGPICDHIEVVHGVDYLDARRKSSSRAGCSGPLRSGE